MMIGRISNGMAALGMMALFLSAETWADNVRVTNPNAISVEALGRSLMYSVNFDRAMNEDMVAGFGFGGTPTKNAAGASAGITATMFPVYFNYYFLRDQGSLFATGGVSILTNSTSVNGLTSNPGGLDFNSSSVLPNFGVGYENRGDTGFLFRFTAYAIVGKSLAPWIGFSLGYAF